MFELDAVRISAGAAFHSEEGHMLFHSFREEEGSCLTMMGTAGVGTPSSLWPSQRLHTQMADMVLSWSLLLENCRTQREYVYMPLARDGKAKPTCPTITETRWTEVDSISCLSASAPAHTGTASLWRKPTLSEGFLKRFSTPLAPSSHSERWVLQM